MKKFLIFLSLLIGCSKTLQINLVSEKPTAQNLSGASVTTTPPNILLIIIDDMGYEVPTYTGGQSYSTPNLDALAAASYQTSACHGSPTCTPSRMMLYSGKYNFRNYPVNRQMDTSVRTIGNLAKLAGYNTGFYGKWQLDGGNYIKTKFGFDRYSVFYPFGSEDTGARYKNPELFSAGSFYYPQGYCDDILVDSVKSFIKDSKTAGIPFLCVYSMSLVHTPWCPTPDDAVYSTWTGKSNVKWFPSMVKYADKKIGKVISYLTNQNISDNTIVIVVGDNGTSGGVTSLWRGDTIQGGKKTTINWATNVPFIATWPGHSSVASTDVLLSFTDLLPTVSDITNTAIPTEWGIIDGRSFYHILNGNVYSNSPFWYLYNGNISNNTREWAMRYDPITHNLIKLYDNDTMFNTTLDPDETTPINDSGNYNYLRNVLNSLGQ